MTDNLDDIEPMDSGETAALPMTAAAFPSPDFGPPPLPVAPPPRPFPGIRWSLLLTFLVLVLQLVLGTAAGLALRFINPELAMHPLTLGLLNLVSFTMILLFAVWLAPGRGSYGFALRGFPLAWLLPAALGMLGLQVVMSDLVNLLLYLVPPPEGVPMPGDFFFGEENDLWASVLTLVLIAPIFEELLFRGFIMHGLLGRHAGWLAILVSAVLFGLLHLLPWQVVPTAIIGVALGWMRLWGGSVLLCIWAHMVNNALALVGAALIPFDIPGYTTEPVDGQVFQPAWLTLGGAVVAVVAFGMLAKAFRRARPGSQCGRQPVEPTVCTPRP